MGKPEEAEVEVSRLPPGSSVSLTILDSIERYSLYPPIPFTGEIPTNLAPKDRACRIDETPGDLRTAVHPDQTGHSGSTGGSYSLDFRLLTIGTHGSPFGKAK